MLKWTSWIGPTALLLLAACGGSEGKERDRPAPLVRAAPAAPARFVQRIEAVGTALANEQVTLSAPVTERIVRLNFDDGDYVTRGQTIAVLSQAQQAASLNEAQAMARESQQQLARVRELKQRGFATNASLDQQTASAAAARAQAAGARAEIADRVVRAPFSGWASLRNISAGAVVQAGTEIATISDISSIKLDFAVPETMLTAIRPGQPIEAVAAAYPERPFRGRIDTIDPVINPNTRAVTVRAVLPNPERLLKPGMLLTVAIETAPRIAPAVPELAVVGEGDTRYVYLLGDDGRVSRTEVRTGARANGRIEIVEGLAPNARVVTEGVVKLADGMQVRVAGARSANARPAAEKARAAGGVKE